MCSYVLYVLKWFKRYVVPYKDGWLPVLVLLAAGVGVRILLIGENWPHVNLDEGVMGEMALNIAYHGEHPIYFYGQNYMGVVQAYMAAAFFHLLGFSLFSLRLGLVLFIAVFLLCMYVLTSMLYTRKMALLTLLLLGLGANLVLYRELQAIGGYPDTLMFGSLVLLLATWLARTSYGEQRRVLRMLAYCSYGLVVGLGLWTDPLVLPCVVCSVLLLLCFCWRDIGSLALPCLLVFFVLGISPVIWYSLQKGPDQNAVSTVVAIFGGHSSLLRTLPYSVFSAIVIGLPTFTNYNPVCSQLDTLFFGGSGLRALGCVIAQGSWGLGAIALWFCSLFLTMKELYVARIQASEGMEERQQEMIRSCGRLAILGTAGLSFVAFASSPTAIFAPYLNSRYLICILVGTPALIYPLWRAASAIGKWRGWRKGVNVGSWVILVGIIAMFFSGTFQTVQDIPNAISANKQQENLAHNLVHIGAIHIYSDLSDCDRIILFSQGKIACNIMDDQMQARGLRDFAIGEIVAHDPRASYVFPLGVPQVAICEQRFGHNKLYRRLIFDSYVVYQAATTFHNTSL